MVVGARNHQSGASINACCRPSVSPPLVCFAVFSMLTKQRVTRAVRWVVDPAAVQLLKNNARNQ